MSTAGELITDHLARQLAALVVQDGRLRADKPTAVNKLRIAARRIRATSATYAGLYTVEPLSSVRSELRWLGQVLGSARDAQVLRSRFAALVATEPENAVLTVLGHRIDDGLADDYQHGRADALAALDSSRYRELVAALAEFVSEPPLTSHARKAAATVLAHAVDRESRRLERAVRAAERAAPGDERDHAFHEARKRAKHLRYAAEPAVAVLGRPAKRVVRRAGAAQDLLGQRQDAVVARALLIRYAAEPGLDVGSTVALERLLTLEERNREEQEAAFLRFWGD